MGKAIDFLKANRVYFLSLIIIVIGFQICYGLDVIIPTNINWLMSAYHDWGQHYLGWAYFRNEGWHFPLGYIQNFNYPAGTNIGYTDSIPLLALFFKLFKFILPETFQYLGIWLLSCHIMAGYFTVKILKLFNTSLINILLAVILVSLNPVLIFRGLHPALCAHWLIIASLYYYLIPPTAQNVNSINKRQILILVLSALINPYLFLMVLGFNVILPVKNYFLDKQLTLIKTCYYIFVSIVSVLFSWFILGMISFDNKVNMEVLNSYGLYSLNLNSFYNAQGFSTFFPQYKLIRDQQYEGFSYLGLGIMILFFISTIYFFISLFKNRKDIRVQSKLLLMFLVLGYTLFAITNAVTLNDKTIFEFPIPDILMKLGGVFRACGRFSWPFYYVILFFSILYFLKIKMSEKAKIVVLSFLVLIQLYDTKRLFTFRDLPYGAYQIKKISEDKWTSITAGFKKIITYPPYDNNLRTPLDYQDFCFIALKHRLPITTGYVARDTGELNSVFSDSLNLSLSEGRINENDLYIISPKYVDAFFPVLYSKKADIRYLDGYYYLYSAKTKIAVQKTSEEIFKRDSIYSQIDKANKVLSIPTPVFQTGKMKINVENFRFNSNIVQVKGWAFLEEAENNKTDSIYIALTNDEKTYLFKTNPIQRPDVTNAFKKGNIDNSGFTATIFVRGIEQKEYDLALAVKSKNNKWTFQKSEGTPKFNLKSITPPKLIKQLPNSSAKIICNVEKADQNQDLISVHGWAAIENKDATNSVINVILINGTTMYQSETIKVKREDVTSYFKNTYNYTNSGFNLQTKATGLKPGKYKIGLSVKDDDKSGFYLTDKEITIR